MHIQTKFHGELEILTDQAWSFPKGIPGFEDEKKFILLPIEGNSDFQVLQSIHAPDVAFVVVNPYTFVTEYSFNVDEPTMDLLEIKREADVFILGVLSLKEPFESSTINLQAPLIFQSKTKKAKQMILNNSTFSIHHKIGNHVIAAEGKA